VPSTTGLDYRLGTTLLTPGSKVELGAGDYTITVTEQPGYTNTGAGSFPVSIANVPTCDDPVEYVVPAVQHEICDAATGVISGAELTFTAVEHITYYLDGTEVVFPVGETAVTLPVVAGDHTVTYESASGYYLKGTALLTSTTETVTVETPADCDDPVEYVKPAVTHETCDNVLGGEKDGTITFTLPENLTYVFDGTEVTPADLTIEKPAGSYSLVVTADPDSSSPAAERPRPSPSLSSPRSTAMTSPSSRSTRSRVPSSAWRVRSTVTRRTARSRS
jgi:hypothetical protein